MVQTQLQRAIQKAPVSPKERSELLRFPERDKEYLFEQFRRFSVMARDGYYGMAVAVYCLRQQGVSMKKEEGMTQARIDRFEMVALRQLSVNLIFDCGHNPKLLKAASQLKYEYQESIAADDPILIYVEDGPPRMIKPSIMTPLQIKQTFVDGSILEPEGQANKRKELLQLAAIGKNRSQRPSDDAPPPSKNDVTYDMTAHLVWVRGAFTAIELLAIAQKMFAQDGPGVTPSIANAPAS